MSRVVLTTRADDLVDLSLQRAPPNAHVQSQQALRGRPGQFAERLTDAARQLLEALAIASRGDGLTL